MEVLARSRELCQFCRGANSRGVQELVRAKPRFRSLAKSKIEALALLGKLFFRVSNYQKRDAKDKVHLSGNSRKNLETWTALPGSG